MDIKFLIFFIVCLTFQLSTATDMDGSKLKRVCTRVDKPNDDWSFDSSSLSIYCAHQFFFNKPQDHSHFWSRLLLCFHVPSVLLDTRLANATRKLLEARVRSNVSAVTCAVSCGGRYQSFENSNVSPAHLMHWWMSTEPILMKSAPQSLLNVRHSDFTDYDFEICSAPDFAALLPKCNQINWSQYGDKTMDVYYKLPTLAWAHDLLEMRCQSTDLANKTFISEDQVSRRITEKGNYRKPRVYSALPPSCSWHNLPNVSVILPQTYVRRQKPRIISTTTLPRTTSTGHHVTHNLPVLPAENGDRPNREGRPPVRGSYGRSDGSTLTGERDAQGQRSAFGASLLFMVMSFASVFCSVFLALGAVLVVRQSVRSRACCRKRKPRVPSTVDLPVTPPVTPPPMDPTQGVLQPSPKPPSFPLLPGQQSQSDLVFVFPSPSLQRPPPPRPDFVRPDFVQFPAPEDPYYDVPYAVCYENWPRPYSPDFIHQAAFEHPNVGVRTLSDADQQETASSRQWVEPRLFYGTSPAAPPGTIAAAGAGAAGLRGDSTKDAAETGTEPVERNNDEDNEEEEDEEENESIVYTRKRKNDEDTEEDEEEDESTVYTRASVGPQPQPQPQPQLLSAKQLAEIAAQNGESNPAYGLSPIVWLRSEGASSLLRTLMPSAANHCSVRLPSQTDSVSNDSVVWVPREGGREALTMHIYCSIGDTLPVGGGHPLVLQPSESGARLVRDTKQLDEAQEEMIRSTTV